MEPKILCLVTFSLFRKTKEGQFYLNRMLVCSTDNDGFIQVSPRDRAWLEKLLEGEIPSNEVDPREMKNTAEKKVITISRIL